MIKKNWKISNNNRDTAAAIAEDFCLDPFAALLLVSRGMSEYEDIEQFLFCDDIMSDPFEIVDIDKAVERIGKAVDNYEKIMIFGDYDADGVTSTSLLYLYLISKGANVSFYIPDRVSEGYGISLDAVRKFKEQDVKLIITVDNGISAVEETNLANELGMDVVITDHHKVGDVLPNAVAVVNPHRLDDESEFKEYAGVGVAFKLVCALDGDIDNVLNQYADLVAIGTLADVVSVTDENRVIIKKGIRKINRNPRIGIEALKEIANVNSKEMNASSVAFSIAPRINAAGRMESAMLAAKLLMSDSISQANEIAQKIDKANRERQAVENEITQKAIEYIENNDKVKYAPVIVVAGEGWHHGVIGIVASRLVSRYGKPAVVITTDGDEGKGSCRSIEGYSIYDALLSVNDMLTHFGGHTLAAGFGIKSKDIDLFRERLCDHMSTYDMPFPTLNVDFNIKPSFITDSLLATLQMFEPYGVDNTQPCFSMKNVTIKSIRPVGEGKHLRLIFTKDSSDVTAMMFSQTLADFPFSVGDEVDIAFKIEKNEFKGEVHPSVHLLDIHFADFDYAKYQLSIRTYEKFKFGASLNEKEINLLTPDRAFFAGVYKYLLKVKSISNQIDAFCKRTGCPYFKSGKVMLSLDVMCELQLVEKTEFGYSIIENAPRVELESSEILKKLARGGNDNG